MNRIRAVAVGLGCAAVLAAVACDDEVTPPTPVPGDFVVALVSPNGEEGAVVLETTDAGILDVSLVVITRIAGGVEIEPAEGEAFHWRAGGTSRIVAYLNEPGEIGLMFSVDDLSRLPDLQIVEVADGENRLRAALTGYQVEVLTSQPAAVGS
ncbi:MAG TPA: hypothetical protein VLC48_00655 [Gemmatimonadota bacterium]|nr:hypothetical protein [Gemmatimonadota bacterium]